MVTGHNRFSVVQELGSPVPCKSTALVPPLDGGIRSYQTYRTTPLLLLIKCSLCVMSPQLHVQENGLRSAAVLSGLL
jgi:hypothetical protein